MTDMDSEAEKIITRLLTANKITTDELVLLTTDGAFCRALFDQKIIKLVELVVLIKHIGAPEGTSPAKTTSATPEKVPETKRKSYGSSVGQVASRLRDEKKQTALPSLLSASAVSMSGQKIRISSPPVAMNVNAKRMKSNEKTTAIVIAGPVFSKFANNSKTVYMAGTMVDGKTCIFSVEMWNTSLELTVGSTYEFDGKLTVDHWKQVSVLICNTMV